MKVKDVKIGKRVKCLQDSEDVIPQGAEGVLIESEDYVPYVSWDNSYEGTYEMHGYKNVYALVHHQLEEI